MKHFYIEDFKYEARFRTYNKDEEFFYRYLVRGESSNYLMNKYKLDYPNIFFAISSNGNYGTCGSTNSNNTKSDVVDLEQEDLDEAFEVLKEIIRLDKRNYEDYLADSTYYKKDSRWRD